MIVMSQNKFVRIFFGIIRTPFVLLTVIAVLFAMICTSITFTWRTGLVGATAYFEESMNEYRKQLKELYGNKKTSQ